MIFGAMESTHLGFFVFCDQTETKINKNNYTLIKRIKLRVLHLIKALIFYSLIPPFRFPPHVLVIGPLSSNPNSQDIEQFEPKGIFCSAHSGGS